MIRLTLDLPCLYITAITNQRLAIFQKDFFRKSATFTTIPFERPRPIDRIQIIPEVDDLSRVWVFHLLTSMPLPCKMYACYKSFFGLS
jgi:hypothetical protein